MGKLLTQMGYYHGLYTGSCAAVQNPTNKTIQTVLTKSDLFLLV